MHTCLDFKIILVERMCRVAVFDSFMLAWMISRLWTYVEHLAPTI